MSSEEINDCSNISCEECPHMICTIDEGELTVKRLVKKAHENAIKHGFWEEIDKLFITSEYGKNAVIGNMLMLIVSEVAEAQNGLRHGDMDNFREELADIAIRLADLCGGLGIDLEIEIMKKMEKNKNRPYKHGKQF